MLEPHAVQLEQLQREIAVLERAVELLKDQRSVQVELQVLIADKQQQMVILLDLAGEASSAATHNQPGGISVAVGNTRSTIGDKAGNSYGNITFGDLAGSDMIKTGDISGSSVAIGRGASSSITTHGTHSSFQAPTELFQPVYRQIDALKKEIEASVNQIERECARGLAAHSQEIEAQLTFLASASPKIMTMIAAILTDPLLITTDTIRAVAIRVQAG